MKPRVFIDIRKNSEDFNGNKHLLNLSYNKPVVFPLKSFITVFIPVIIFVSFILGSVTAPTSGEAQAQTSGEQRAALEAQLADYEKQISETEATIDQYKKQGKSLSLEVKKLEAQVAKLNLQIKAVNLNLSKLDKQIGDTQKQIYQTQDEIEQNKENITILLQKLYENGNKGMVEVMLKNPNISDFFSDLSGLVLIQDNLRTTLQKIVESRQKLVDQKEVLALQRSDVQALKEYQDQQKQSIVATQEEKNQLLKETKATGVRPALILAILHKESALGKNVGQCNYKSAMHPTRDIPIFLNIVESLGLTKNLEAGILKVSCANADGAYGGAMGPAQFIPSTWKGYSTKISAITGSSPANPWDNEDAFVATALYMRDLGAANASLNQERIAAAKYYSGSRWRTYLWTYGDRVVIQAEKFQDDIDVLNS